ncbi:serine hydrolase domain-containing protein [Rheinheimera baltica]|uniref:serine hydrolase domain-containing protein n=1 Tax=Rheinheimera baltica TaxID=67576 RepID=UPI00041B52FB|nr:serine hydrolase domain-containing protein [Rheinheimera baltica]
MKYLLIGLLLIVTLHSRADTEQAIAQARFLINAHMEQTGTPGAQVAVWQHGTLLWSEAFGLANLENNQKMTTATPMRIASISKSLTSVVLMELVEEGKLQLDTPLHQYLPGLPLALHHVTLRQLAASVSGIRHYDDTDKVNHTHYATARAALSRFINDPPEFSPGSQFGYSSYGWVIIAAVMEQVTAQPFSSLMQRHWQQQQLHNTFLDHTRFHPAVVSTQYDLHQPSWWRSWLLGEQPTRIAAVSEDRSFIYPGGGFLSTAEDLVHYGTRLLQGQVLQQTSVDEMWQSYRLADGSLTHYALGWETGKNRLGSRVIFHSGSMPSARSHLVIFPKHKLVVAILMNSGEHVFFNEREAHTVAELFIANTQPDNTNLITGEWQLCTTSLRNTESCGQLSLQTDSVTGLVSGEVEFVRSDSRLKMPLVLTTSHNKVFTMVAVSPMFIDLKLQFEPGQLLGHWYHDFNVNGATEVDDYWLPRKVVANRVNSNR